VSDLQFTFTDEIWMKKTLKFVAPDYVVTDKYQFEESRVTMR